MSDAALEIKILGGFRVIPVGKFFSMAWTSASNIFLEAGDVSSLS
jgi:hypothetical protein